MKRLKILVSAFNCSPDHGSEPAIGWGFVRTLAERHDLHVITEGTEFRENIESHLDRHPEMRRGVTFHYIPAKTDHLANGMLRPFIYLVYRNWQRKALRLARNLHARIGFDLAHHVTTCRYAEPGLLWKLPLPFVWGPTGGMENLSWRFIGSLNPAGILFHFCRNLVNSFQARFALLPRKAARRAGKGLIAATSENREKMRRSWGKPAHLICEMGIWPSDRRSPTLREEGSPLRLSWSADHISAKALPLLLDALGRLKGSVDWHLDILGSGSRTGPWKRKAERLGIDGRCTWHGWIPREKAMEVVRKSHAFVITSLSDMTSSVLMEAISLGVPVICLDHCGFRDVVTDECGIKIPVRTPSQVSEDMAHAIEKIWGNEPWRRRLAEGALRRAEDFSWEGKMEALEGIYAGIIRSPGTPRISPKGRISGKRLKVLVSAYACSPSRGSEPAIGWGFVKAVSEHHDVWIITEEGEFKQVIESYLDRHPEMRRRMSFHYITEKINQRMTAILPFFLYRYHRQWQKKAFHLAQDLHNRIGFDLVHQVTNSGFREPGYLWRLPTPFIWGPTGGMENLPWRFIPSLGVHGIIFHSFRNIINMVQMRWSVRPKRAAGRARKSLIAATAENRDKIARFWGRRAHVICEMGRGENRAEPHSLREEGVPLRLAWSGEHISRKALPLLLDALSLLEDRVEWRLDIFGNGNRTGAWRRKAQRLGIDERCTWHDWIPRKKAMAIVGGAHIFVITSLSDMTSSVLMEAISLGVPVICLDHCGFRDVVTEKCGIKIPVRTPAQVSAGIAGAIEKIWNDEPGRRRMAEGALRRAEDFSWEGKMEILNGIYADALESGRGKS